MNPPRLCPQFCILDYKANQGDLVERRTTSFLAALFDLDDEDCRYKLKLFIDPRWREFVKAEDRDYIDLLLKDFVARIEQDPEMLFKHLCSLAAGPLVTIEAGTSLDATSDLSVIERLMQL